MWALTFLPGTPTRLSAEHVGAVEQLIRTNSWWDTVDGLAPNVIGPIVMADSEVAKTMDEWIRDDDFWIVRSAILHQLRYRDHTDADRLFGYVESRAGDTEFFIRKASGWALREYARTNPTAVYAFVDRMGDRLSGLTRREALKHSNQRLERTLAIAAELPETDFDRGDAWI